MCELFGVSSNKKTQINEYLEAFYKHSNQHPDGWGLALMRNKESKIEKEPIKASDSKKLRKILDNPIITKNAFAHIRLATTGQMEPKNCHPFKKIDNNNRTWTLMHNGTIFNNTKIEQYKTIQEGDTDSERVLLYIVDEINKTENKIKRQLTSKERFELLDKLVTDLAEDNKLNLMLYDGSLMYFHTNSEGGLHYLKKDNTIYVTTNKLNDENWEVFPLNTLIAIKDGKIVHQGKTHNNEYRITLENFKFIMNNLTPTMKENLIKNFGEITPERFLESQQPEV